MRILAERIKVLRNSSGKSQQQLADEVGEKRATISHWEQGRISPNPNQLVSLASALNTTVHYLMGEDNSIEVLKSSKPITIEQIDYNMLQLRKERKKLVQALINQKVDEYVELLVESPTSEVEELRRVLRLLVNDVSEIENPK